MTIQSVDVTFSDHLRLLGTPGEQVLKKVPVARYYNLMKNL